MLELVKIFAIHPLPGGAPLGGGKRFSLSCTLIQRYSGMSTELRARAQAFLNRGIPSGMDYAPDSIAERIIATYANRGRLPEGDENAELIELAHLESSAMADQMTDPSAAGYFRECAAILEALMV